MSSEPLGGEKIIGVSELNRTAKTLLNQKFSDTWVAGEISNLTQAASGHYYFTLKDDAAQVRCVLFKMRAARLIHPPKAGDLVEVIGQVGVYEARGDYQITLSNMRIQGIGKLHAAYEALKQKLLQEGLFDASKKKRLPANMRRIGIVTSLAAAALRDIITTLKRRHPDFCAIVYPASVQGKTSAEELARAIKTADERQEVDVLLVCRGGGSLEDLWSFNEEIVVRAVAECSLPVVSGVGHEIDFTLTDFAADVRAPTPTGAAELVSPDRAELSKKVPHYAQLLHRQLQQRYADAAQKVDWISQAFPHPKQLFLRKKEHVNQLESGVKIALMQQYHAKKQHLALLHEKLNRHQPNTKQLNDLLDYFSKEIRQHTHANLSQARSKIQHMLEMIQALSPQHILERGFSVVTNRRGQVIRSAAEVKGAQALQIRLAEGALRVRAEYMQQQRDLFD